MFKKYIALLFALALLTALFTGCSHKETKEEPVVHEEEVPPPPPPEDNKKGSAEDMLAVYQRLIDGIRRAELDKILSCYAEEGSYGYSEENRRKFKCYNDEYEVFGIEPIESQYRYLFKKRLLDRIEFDVRVVNEEQLYITFINAWARADYRVAETIYFEVIDSRYYIKRHLTHPYDE